MQGYKSAHEDSFPQRIIVTGHSLGGALATLAAAHIATCYDEFREENDKYTERRLQVYTLAAPRVGDEQLCSHFKDELGLTAVQMKNELDPTPYVAPYASKAQTITTKPNICSASLARLGQV
jgi:predicted lipase